MRLPMSHQAKFINPHLDLCQHQRYPRECFRCQMLVFFCVNEYGGRLPHIDNDACRVIFQHLRIANARSRNKSVKPISSNIVDVNKT